MKKHWIMIDCETDGPQVAKNSMFEFGAVSCNDISLQFHGRLKPISEHYVKEALAVSKYSRDDVMLFPDAEDTMKEFSNWLKINFDNQVMFVSDNNGFDWQFVNWYMWEYLGKNPFGHSSTNLGSLYKGICRNSRFNFKRYRKTKHTHNPIDDCIGNIEALNVMKTKYRLQGYD